jgi:hypothetical protein
MAANPAGRGALERFAVELADSDAQMLGDGGNAYVFAVPELKEFLGNFTQLPARAFTNFGPAVGPVIIRTSRDKEFAWFYVVNRSSTEKQIVVEFDTGGNVEALADGSAQVIDGHLTIKLSPFALFVGRTGTQMHLTRFL